MRSTWLCSVAYFCLLGGHAHVRAAEANDPQAETLRRFGQLQRQRLSEGKPPLGFEDLIEMSDVETQRKYVRGAVDNAGPFLQFASRWKIIDRGDLAARWVLHEAEPMSADTLTALENILRQDSTTLNDGVPLAAVLYRYRRNSGEKYLKKHLADSEVAARILVLNGERVGVTDGKVLLEPQTSEQVRFLAGWGSNEARLAIENGIKAEGGLLLDYLASLCIVKGRISSQTTERVRHYFEVTDSRPGKMLAAGALVRFGGKSIADSAIRTLQIALEGSGQPEFRYDDQAWASWVAMTIVDGRLKAGLRKLISAYVNDPQRPGISSVEARAIVAIGNNPEESDVNLVSEALEAAKAVNSSQSIMRQVHAGLFRGGSAKVRQVLEEVVGGEEYNQIREIEGLQKLPRELTPIGSRFYDQGLAPFEEG